MDVVAVVGGKGGHLEEDVYCRPVMDEGSLLGLQLIDLWGENPFYAVRA